MNVYAVFLKKRMLGIEEFNSSIVWAGRKKQHFESILTIYEFYLTG